MKRSIWDRRIPTLFGLVLLGISIGIITFLAQHRIIYLGNAAPSDVPKNVKITNISEDTFTITYTTDASVLGVISYGVDKNTPQTALDDRDQATGVPTQHTIHSITINKLQPKTTYYFSIKSGDTTYLDTNNLLYQAITGPHINAPPTSEKPLTGKVMTADGNTPSEVLVFVHSDTGQLLSTVGKPTGFYIIPLTTWRNKTLDSYVTPPMSVQIQATDGSANAQASFTLNDENAVPLITLSKNYDFTQDVTTAASISASPSLPGLPLYSASSSGNVIPAITTPNNNAGLVDAQPEIKGVAPPNTTVEIVIHSSDVVTGNVTANSSGIWSFRPTTPLSPGLHTITVTIKDLTGNIIKTLQESFTVYAQGSQVNQSATPSATPTTGIIQPTDTNTPTPPIATNTPTAIPSETVTPTEPLISFTPTPTLLAFGNTITPESTGVTSPTPTPKLITGSESIPFIGIMGFVTLLAGICIFLATQGSTL